MQDELKRAFIEDGIIEEDPTLPGFLLDCGHTIYDLKVDNLGKKYCKVCLYLELSKEKYRNDIIFYLISNRSVCVVE